MAKRGSARCASCGRKGRPKDTSDYICKSCQDGGYQAPPRATIEVEDLTEQRLSANTYAALQNSKGVPVPRKKQNRKSISLKGLTEQRLKDYCQAEGRSVSGYVEEIATEKLDALGVPVVTEADLPPEPEPEPYERDWDLPLML
jgi:hypothetical protein